MFITSEFLENLETQTIRWSPSTRFKVIICACIFSLQCSVVPVEAAATLSEEPNEAFGAALERAGVPDEVGAIMEFEELPEGGEDPGTELIGGSIVDGTFFPAVFRASTGSGSCTASVIGPASALLAAHCFSSDVAVVNFKIGNRRTRALCEVAPGFSTFRSDDWMLCLLENSLGGITFEAVDVNDKPEVNKRIVLTGFGCTAEGQAAAVRPLKAGVSRHVAQPSSVTTGQSERSYIYSRSNLADNEGILCPGDSGGPAFVILGNTISDSRKIVGVNSRTVIQDGIGFISATASSAGADFLKNWTQTNDQVVCGINAGDGVKCMWRPD